MDSLMSNDGMIVKSFRLPKDLINKFDKKYPKTTSKVIRGLIQMLLDGKISEVEYKTSQKFRN